ncbi:MAG: cytochrome c oxidase subunit II [Chloroflexi bacterium]|nr:cytochrome c oxidase subunit II [Chloroflexota bacterium]
MKHIIGVIAFIAGLTLAAWAWLGSGFDQLLPFRASEEAFYVDRLFGMHLYVIGFLFALIMGFMFYSIIVFRRKPGEKGDGDYFHGNTTLEIFWTIIPLGIVLYFAVLGAQYLKEITEPEVNELVVEVTGSQWNWRFDYPEYGIISGELYLPRNRQTVLQITSIDVIHSFWVPEFRIKQDAVPGMVHPLRITPTETGDFKIRCAEICGKDHTYMLADVHVLESTDFIGWVEEQIGPLTVESSGENEEEVETAEVEQAEAALGKILADVNGCFKCHSIDGTPGDGPTWLGIYGTEEVLEDGSSVIVDEAYIRNSILNPQDQLVAGFTDVDMPVNFAAVLSDGEIDALVDFIESLGN